MDCQNVTSQFVMCHGGRSNVGVKVSSTVGDSLFLDNQVVPSQDVLRQVVKIPMSNSHKSSCP